MASPFKSHGSMSSIHVDAWSDNNSDMEASTTTSNDTDVVNTSSPNLMSCHKKELVAIVIRVPLLASNGPTVLNSDSDSDGRSRVDKLSEDKRLWHVNVVLPKGEHGIPKENTPLRCPYSSLIERWHSGGSCECGGWDLGCGLKVLSSNRNNNIDILVPKLVHHDHEQAPWTIFSQVGPLKILCLFPQPFLF